MTTVQPPQSHAADVFSSLPTSPSAENNKAPILEKWLAHGFDQEAVLEIGSGTGQQAVHITQHCPKVTWQPTEVATNLPVLNQWWSAAQAVGIINLLEPQCFEVAKTPLPGGDYTKVYTSNVLHIVQPEQAELLVEQICETLRTGQQWICYGPFKRDGEFTTDSNREFNDWLLSEGHGGLLDIEEVLQMAKGQLELVSIEDMPANNFFVVFNRR